MLQSVVLQAGMRVAAGSGIASQRYHDACRRAIDAVTLWPRESPCKSLKLVQAKLLQTDVRSNTVEPTA
jgi:hypothetical protein